MRCKTAITSMQIRQISVKQIYRRQADFDILRGQDDATDEPLDIVAMIRQEVVHPTIRRLQLRGEIRRIS